MAHEFLKFKIDLNDKENFQPVLGSQDYGTFYMVYIQIKKYESFINDAGIEQHNYTCDFKLQNFIGDITIGFAENSPNITFPNANPKDPIDASLNIKVSPFNTNRCIKDRIIELEKPLSSGMIMQTTFERNSPPNSLYDPQKPGESEYLNPYRFIRDGEDYLEISSRVFPDTSPFPIPDASGYPRGFCVPNRSIII